MIEYLDLTLDLDLVYLLAAAFVLYFGRLIADVQVRRYDENMQRYEGFLFSIIYILIPASGAYLVLASDLLWFEPNSLVSLLGLSLILSIYKVNFLANKSHKYELLETERFSKKVDERMEELSISEDLADKGRDFLGQNYKEFYRDLFPAIKSFTENKKVIMTLSGLTSLFFFSALGSNLFILTLIVAMSILSYSSAAITYGYSRSSYPYYNVRLEGGKTISGKLIRKTDDELILCSDKEKISVRRDQVELKRKSIWKNDKPSYDGGTRLKEWEGIHGGFNYVIRNRDLHEKIDHMRTSLANWMDNQNFEAFESEEIDVAIVYEYTNEDSALDLDNLIKPVICSLEKDNRAKEGHWIVEDDSQIKQILAKSINRDDIGQENVPVEKDDNDNWIKAHGRLTISFRRHSEKPMRLIDNQEVM